MLTRRHPALQAFRRFLEGEPRPEECRAIVRHLLGGCPDCRGRVLTAVRQATESIDWSYDAAFEELERRIATLHPEAVAPRAAPSHWAAHR